MLTFRRALIFAVVALSLLLILRAHHPAHRFHNADDLPKPKSVEDWVQKNIVETERERAEAAASANKIAQNHVALPPRRNKAKQIPLQDLRSKPLREQLAIQFPYDVESRFPGYIWQTWKVTPASGKFEEEFRELEASWTKSHPSFVHEVISDEMAPHLMKHLFASIPEVLEAYHALPVPVLKADFFRYLILLARGGIYSDIDTAAIKPATDWVPADVPRSSYGMVIGIEADPDRPDWADWYSRRIQFCQWTIQSKPGHPILRNIVANITEETLKRKAAGTLSPRDVKGIVEFTGPAIWTDTVFDFFNDPNYFDMSNSQGNITWKEFTGMKSARKVGDVVVLPITSFSPGVKQMGAGEDDDPMAFVKHHFGGTWKPESERHIGENNDK